MRDFAGTSDRDLVVTTTFDPRLQTAAEAAIDNTIARDGTRDAVGQGALVAMTRYIVRRLLWGALLLVLVSALTFVLGATFLGLEISEFVGMVVRGAGPSRSAFLSAFFSLVGLHGAHVTAGLLWLSFMVAQTAARGPRDFVRRRLLCFSLFWHALDIIWVGLLTLVYLMGAR